MEKTQPSKNTAFLRTVSFCARTHNNYKKCFLFLPRCPQEHSWFGLLQPNWGTRRRPAGYAQALVMPGPGGRSQSRTWQRRSYMATEAWQEELFAWSASVAAAGPAGPTPGDSCAERTMDAPDEDFAVAHASPSPTASGARARFRGRSVASPWPPPRFVCRPTYCIAHARASLLLLGLCRLCSVLSPVTFLTATSNARRCCLR